MVLFSSPKLTVNVAQTTLYLHPSPSSLGPADDQILKGFITLSLPKSRAFSKITAKFEGKSRLAANGGYGDEEVEIIKNELVVDLSSSGNLPAGEHQYEFSFILPAVSATYERCVYGHTRYFVSAVCEGVGAFSTNVSSPLLMIYPIGNPAPRGTVPGNFDTLIANYAEELGPISIGLSSPYLTVSSLLFYDITLNSPPPGLKLISIKGFISQQFLVQFTKGPFLSPETQHLLFSVSTTSPSSHFPYQGHSRRGGVTNGKSEKELARLPCSINLMETPPLAPIGDKGEEWTYRKLCRLPHDDILRPTTMEDSSSRIRVSHKLGVEFRYMGIEDGVEVEKVMLLQKKVEVTSCCALLDAPSLPSYSCALSDDPPLSSSPTQIQHARSRNPNDPPFRQVTNEECTCAHSIEHLIEEGDKMLGLPTPESSIRTSCGERTGVVGEEERERKTPAVGLGREWALGSSSASAEGSRSTSRSGSLRGDV